jgi:hypothetical protein
MPRANNTQLTIHSAFALAKAREIAEATGMSVTEVLEDALRSYMPSASRAVAARLVRRGPVWVVQVGGASVGLDDANFALEAERETRP